MKLIVTRPEADARELITTLADNNIEALCAPLMDIVPRQNVDIPELNYQAVLATSANGVRAIAAHAMFDVLKNVPLFAVGEASAQKAHEAGFAIVHTASGDLAGLADLVRQELAVDMDPLLYASGNKIAGDLAGILGDDGYDVRRVVFYDAMARSSLDPQALDALGDNSVDGVILMSPRTAKIWCDNTLQLGPALLSPKLTYYCLSRAVADVINKELPTDDSRVLVSTAPTKAALLKLILSSRGS